MGSKNIKQLMNFGKLPLPYQKRNSKNCREAIFQALSTCNEVRIYLVCPAGVRTAPGMQNVDKMALRSSNGFQLLKRKREEKVFSV